jgi:hypothetical protein
MRCIFHGRHCSKRTANPCTVRTGDFQAQEVKIKVRNESQVVVEGLNEGTVVALVNPDEALKKTGSASGPLTPGVSR